MHNHELEQFKKIRHNTNQVVLQCTFISVPLFILLFITQGDTKVAQSEMFILEWTNRAMLPH